MKKYLKTALNRKGCAFTLISKIQGEASTRSFFRVGTVSRSLIAMVYPEPADKEIKRIIRLTDVYRKHGLNVPAILDTFQQRVIILEDLGDYLLQKEFSHCKKDSQQIKAYLEAVADILLKLKTIPLTATQTDLDTDRMKWEMDFFLKHAICGEVPGLRDVLHNLAEHVVPVNTFAHRDFHSRNMLVHQGEIFLVDFQDSLKAAPYYDLVSLAFDSYLDLGNLRQWFFDRLQQRGLDIDMEKLYITALQRNIKAMGTFGFQVNVRKNLAYKKYIARTQRHITTNPLFPRFFKHVPFPSFQ